MKTLGNSSHLELQGVPALHPAVPLHWGLHKTSHSFWGPRAQSDFEPFSELSSPAMSLGSSHMETLGHALPISFRVRKDTDQTALGDFAASGDSLLLYRYQEDLDGVRSCRMQKKMLSISCSEIYSSV